MGSSGARSGPRKGEGPVIAQSLPGTTPALADCLDCQDVFCRTDLAQLLHASRLVVQVSLMPPHTVIRLDHNACVPPVLYALQDIWGTASVIHCRLQIALVACIEVRSKAYFDYIFRFLVPTFQKYRKQENPSVEIQRRNRLGTLMEMLWYPVFIPRNAPVWGPSRRPEARAGSECLARAHAEWAQGGCVSQMPLHVCGCVCGC